MYKILLNMKDEYIYIISLMLNYYLLLRTSVETDLDIFFLRTLLVGSVDEELTSMVSISKLAVTTGTVVLSEQSTEILKDKTVPKLLICLKQFLVLSKKDTIL